MRILVIEPDVQLRRIIRFILEREGYDVVESGGEDELQRRQDQAPDLVLLEVELPNRSGWDVCAQICAADAMPIVVLTTSDWPADVERGRSLGVAGYLTKPFSAAELAMKIRSRLQQAPPLRLTAGKQPWQ